MADAQGKEEYYVDLAVRVVKNGWSKEHVGFVSFWTADRLEYKNNIGLMLNKAGEFRLQWPEPPSAQGRRSKRTIELFGPRLQEVLTKSTAIFNHMKENEPWRFEG